MSKKSTQRFLSYFLCAMLTFCMLPSTDGAAAKKITLSSKKITLNIRQSKVLKVKNTKKKINWKITSGKKYISVKRKGKTALTICGKKKGTAKVRVTAGKKKLTCKVIVKSPLKKPSNKATKNPSTTNAPNGTPAPTNIPIKTPGPTNAPAGANAQDLAAIKSLIPTLTKLGATVQNDLSSNDYKWDKGRLTEIHWDSKKLSGSLDLSGFTALNTLICSRNELHSLNVSQNTALTELDCADNPLKNLNVSGNARLEELSCWNNELSTLDVSRNTALKELDCANNALTALDVSNNINMEDVSCWGNNISSLDVSKNAVMKELDCAGNPLTSLDLSGNTALEELNCSDIASDALDVTKNTNLTELFCWGNQLKTLDVSQNTKLEELFCGNNSLSHLDVSRNTALKELSCGGNSLDGLNVSANTALTGLFCDRSGIGALDVSANSKLEELSCNDNGLKSLDVSKNTSLKKLTCNSNHLENLDVTKNNALERLSCKDNSIKSLNLNKNSKITDLAQDSSVAVTGYDPLSHVTKNYEIPDNMKWWAYDKFGMFIHFGAYSQYGQGEWAMSEQKMSKEKYQTECIAGFNPTDFNAEEIVKYAKAAGMKYIVITSKHHEGFSMWDTQVESFKDYTGSKTFSLQKYTDFGATGRDVLKELKTACEKEGLKFGLYYSIVDWNHSSQTLGGTLSSTMASMEARTSYITDMKAQLKELVDRYDPAVIWFDGDWSRSSKDPNLQIWWTKSDGVDLYDYMKSISPNIVINERVCRSFGLGDFECPEREIPKKNSIPNRAWETCQSMNDAWGYKEALENSYYSSDQLIKDLATVAAEGGNYLLNIGPKGTGKMTDGSRDILNKFSKWINVNGESIYNVSSSPFSTDPSWGTYTRKNNTVYAHVHDWGEPGSLLVERYDNRQIDKITILGKSCELNYKVAGDHVIIQKPKNPSNDKNLVIAIQYK